MVRNLAFNNVLPGKKYNLLLYVFYFEDGKEKNYKINELVKVIAVEKASGKVTFSLLEKCSVSLMNGHKHFFNSGHLIPVYKENFN